MARRNEFRPAQPGQGGRSVVCALRLVCLTRVDSAEWFFRLDDLGLTILGRHGTVSGEWTDVAVLPDGHHTNISLLQTPDGNGRLELFVASTRTRSRRTQPAQRDRLLAEELKKS